MAAVLLGQMRARNAALGLRELDGHVDIGLKKV